MNTPRTAVFRLGLGFLVVLAVALTITWPREVAAQQAYDAYGYDYRGRVFSGLYENADRDSANNTGDATRLRMEWSEQYNVAFPELSAIDAWVTQSQRGTYVGADGRTYRWAYSVRLRFTGAGSPLWGYFTLEDESHLDTGNSMPQARPLILPTAKP